MTTGSVTLVGLPDSGKTVYLCSLWSRLMAAGTELPQNIGYVEEGLRPLMKGEWPQRTNPAESPSDTAFDCPVPTPDGSRVTLSVPDVEGEMWRTAVKDFQIPETWMRQLQTSVGALVFVRVHSDENVEYPDWVTSRKLLSAGPRSGPTNRDIPTADQMCELLTLLDDHLHTSVGLGRPRVGVLVTAWDLLHSEDVDCGPRELLKREFPLFGGRLEDNLRADVRVFGVSSIGGDFAEPRFRQRYLSGQEQGYVVGESSGGGGPTEKADLALPVQWVMGLDA